jgi:transposase-like protein
MTKKRRQYPARFKFKVAMEAHKETKTISQIASEYEVHPTLVGNWKRQLSEEGEEVFKKNGKREERERARQEAELYEQIGRLKMELEWLKKKAARFD